MTWKALRKASDFAFNKLRFYLFAVTKSVTSFLPHFCLIFLRFCLNFLWFLPQFENCAKLIISKYTFFRLKIFALAKKNQKKSRPPNFSSTKKAKRGKKGITRSQITAGQRTKLNKNKFSSFCWFWWRILKIFEEFWRIFKK